MRSCYHAIVLFALVLPGVTQVPSPNAQVAQNASELSQAMIGAWVGVLEYRDYSEPATSQKRVQLPTWLTIQAGAEGLNFAYIYDDGPAKTLKEQSVVKLDGASRTYTVLQANDRAQVFQVTGWELLKAGRGTLTLTGAGLDNKKPAELRTTFTIRRNLLSWLEEVRPAGSSDPFTFRHLYTYTRASSPVGN